MRFIHVMAVLSALACTKSSAPAPPACDACEQLKGHVFMVNKNCTGMACASLSLNATGSGAWMKNGQVRMGQLQCASGSIQFVGAGLTKPIELNATCSEFTWDGDTYVAKK